MANGNEKVAGFLRGPVGRHLPGLVVITYVGPKSGRRIEFPVIARRVDDGWLVAVGRAERKRWYRSFRRPLEATVTARGVEHPVTGQLLDGDRADRARRSMGMRPPTPIVAFTPR
jgi:hypothetical protein